ncbi:uncharacterized protein LOC118437379 [Folsomia candida]|uniref:uncharacterized protein LOC118437379 n=1 Tax=Folsomia candida TaxID=158441 RepID=UPI001604F882|nr:uncharacterized protein LOC118437379 [Folsomia candida]
MRSKEPLLSYHRFPQKKIHTNVCKRWIEVLHPILPPDFMSSDLEKHTICSRHFKSTDFLMREMRRSQLLPTAIPTEHLDATSPVKDPPIDVRIACNMSLQGSLKDTRIAESGARLEITCRLLIEGGHREILCGSSTCVVTQDGKFQSDCDLLPCALPVASNATSFKALTPFSINRAREEHNYSKRPTESIKVVQARQQLLAKRLRNAKLSLLRRRRSVKKLKDPIICFTT